MADVGTALRACAARFEDSFDGRAQVLVADDLPPLGSASVAALTGAVGEAMMNAGKHGRAGKVQVYVEPTIPAACSARSGTTGVASTWPPPPKGRALPLDPGQSD